MKSIYLLFLTVIVSAGLITGCGSDKKEPATQKTEKAVTEKAVVEKVKESVTRAAETVEADTAKAIKATKTVVKKTVRKIEKKSAEVKKAISAAIPVEPAPKQTATKPVKPAVAVVSPAVSKENIKLGGSIFKAKCALCHGVNGKGSAMAPAFVGNKWIKEVTRADISAVIKRGRRGTAKKYPKFQTLMPAHSSMPANEVSALVSYIKSIN